MTPEQEEKHKEFVKARLRHYSNEVSASPPPFTLGRKLTLADWLMGL